jgi:hypothetical protein
MEKYEFIFLIFSCEKNKNRLKVLKKKSWFKEFSSRKNVKTLVVFGNKGNKKSFVEGENLFLMIEEKFTNLSIKLEESFKYVVKNYKFDYLIKCDDDVGIKNFDKVIKICKKYDYAGRMVTTTKKRAFLWSKKNSIDIDLDKHIEVKYAWGGFFLINYGALKLIMEKLHPFVEYYTKFLGGNSDTVLGKTIEEMNLEKKVISFPEKKDDLDFLEKNIFERLCLDNFIKKFNPSYLISRFF